LPKFFGITGTPGTGKKTVAPLVSKLMGISCFGINELAFQFGLTTRESDLLEVDTRELGRRITTSSISCPSVVFGHLLPYVMANEKVSRVAVLRCEPRVLRNRLEKRGYPSEKIDENVEAEFIGVISADSIRTYGGRHVWEFDTSHKEPAVVAKELAGVFQMKQSARSRIDWVSSYASVAELRSLLPSESGTSAFT
jgi:adenylate kinase